MPCKIECGAVPYVDHNLVTGLRSKTHKDRCVSCLSCPRHEEGVTCGVSWGSKFCVEHTRKYKANVKADDLLAPRMNLTQDAIRFITLAF